MVWSCEKNGRRMNTGKAFMGSDFICNLLHNLDVYVWLAEETFNTDFNGDIKIIE
jgi:hypothetical protein